MKPPIEALPVERVIGDEGLACANGLMRLAVRLPWYRALPLSTAFVEQLEIDGVAVDPASVQFHLQERSWTLEQLAEETHSFWFVLDSAFLEFPWPGAAPGGAYEVAVTIAIFPPYIPGMKRANSERRMMVAA